MKTGISVPDDTFDRATRRAHELLGEFAGSRPAKRRPVLVVSADAYNRSRLATVVVAVLTSSTRLATMPGTVFLPAGRIPGALLAEVDRGLRRVLDL